MSGALSRPLNMRNNLYNYNWRIGYQCIPIAAITLIAGAFWVKFKRDRYDRFFEKMANPAEQEFVREHTSLTVEKYDALIKRMQEEMRPIKDKYGIQY